MKMSRICLRHPRYLLLPALLLTAFFLFFTGRDSYAEVEAVRRALRERGLNQSCKLLECSNLDECISIKEAGDQRIDLSKQSLSNHRCEDILENVKTGSRDELEMPLSFSILAHRDFAQLYRLLEAVYRPHNLYCIQLDNKSDSEFVRTVESLVGCLAGQHKNIFLSSRSISLVWQHSSLLEGDLFCLEQLVERTHPWKYYINIVGSEFPLITNHQLVRKLGGVTTKVGFVHTMQSHEEVKLRWKYSHILPNKKSTGFQTTFFGSYYKNVPQRTSVLKSPPPKNLTIMYGLKNSAISREFGEFVINAAIAKDLRSWLWDVQVAVEHFYPTLATVFVNKEHTKLQDFTHMQEFNSFVMRKTFWAGEGYSCQGQLRREICVLSLMDLPKILEYSEVEGFVVNKFDTLLDSSVVDCLSEILYGDQK